MGGLSTFFGWSADSESTELPNIYPLPVPLEEFVRTDVMHIYAKILVDVIERTQGLTDDHRQVLFDNCLKSESADGLITMIAKAMSEKADLFIVYDAALKLARIATQQERAQIEADYKARGESTVGVYISFKKYLRTDMVKLYSELEYNTIGALSKSLNIAKAVQLKLSDIRGSVSITDSAAVKAQGQVIARSLSEGCDVMLDAKDSIETATPDLTATEKSILFLNQKRAFYLGLPASYIAGEMPGGLGDKGAIDSKLTERGLKNYYFSVVKPVLEKIFKVSLAYKSQDFRQIEQGLSAMQTFSITEDDMITHENKVKIINQLFDFEDGQNEPKPTPKVSLESDKQSPKESGPGFKG